MASFGLGLRTIEVFRWLLVLLVALVLEKGAEGITFRVTGTTPHHFDGVYVYALMTDRFPNSTLLYWPHWSYLTGLLQFCTTALFAARYFICLVDPLGRFVVTDDSQLSNSVIAAKLAELSPSTGVRVGLIIVIISLFEFVFLFDASTSLAQYEQWIYFLMTLVAGDTIFFLLIVRNLYRVPQFRLRCLELHLRLIQNTTWLRTLSHGLQDWVGSLRHFLGSVELAALSRDVDQRRSQRATELKERIDLLNSRISKHARTIPELRKIATDYGPWNFLDFFVLSVALAGCLFYRDTSSWCLFYLPPACLLIAFFLCGTLGSEKARRIRLLIGFVVLGIMLTALLFYLAGIHYEHLRWHKEIFFFGLSLIVFFGTAWFSYWNFRTQPDLWLRHLRVLTVRAPTHDDPPTPASPQRN